MKEMKEFETEAIKHEFNVSFAESSTRVEFDLKELEHQINLSASFYGFLMTTRLAVSSTDNGYFSVLPLEIVLHIFSFLQPLDLCRVAQVCKLWRMLGEDSQLWKDHCFKKWDLKLVESVLPKHKKWKWVYQSKARVFGQKEIKNGVGCFTLSNGNIYEGDWKDDKREGWGVSQMTNKRIFCGQWKDDKRTGHGIFTWPTGDIYIGNWKDSKRIGKGKYTWADGRVYEGEWVDDKRNGFGVSTCPDGRKYIGEYKEGKRHGLGRCYYPDGGRYEGEYVHNKRHGIGTYTWPDNDRYVGLWLKGRRVGAGTFIAADGNSVRQEWKEEQWDPTNKGLTTQVIQ